MKADILALDPDGQPVLVVEVKDRILEEDTVSQLLAYMESQGPPIPYGMVVDLEKICVVKYDCDNPIGHSHVFDAEEILTHYDPDFAKKRIFHQYLSTLVETWLRDLAYHWKSENPPGAEPLAAIGLLPRIEGGKTQSEVTLGVNALH